MPNKNVGILQKKTTELPPILTIGGLSDSNFEPGQCVPVDLNVAMSTVGCLPNIFGTEKVKLQSTGRTIFVDHSSCYIFNKHQHSNTTTADSDSVLSKYYFDDYCSSLCED